MPMFNGMPHIRDEGWFPVEFFPLRSLKNPRNCGNRKGGACGPARRE
jgi:hypothetical protein